MKKLKKSKAGKLSQLCRQIGEPANRNEREPARQLHTHRGVPASTAPIANHLNQILLAMGYEASLVEMLGRKYRR